VLPQRQVLRARVVLLAADVVANEVIAERLSCSKPNLLEWRSRFQAAGLEGVEEAPGRGRPATYGQDFVEKVVATTFAWPPAGTTHWSTRTVAKEVGASAAALREAIQRFLDAWNVRCRPFTLVEPADQVFAPADRRRSSEAGH
jgi:hypothetical protein